MVNVLTVSSKEKEGRTNGTQEAIKLDVDIEKTIEI